jgi:hypothetical protein
MVSFKYTKLDGLSSASLGDELLDVGHREPNRLWTNLFPSNFLPMAVQPVFALVETLRSLTEPQQVRWFRRSIPLGESRLDFFPNDSTKLSDFESNNQGFRFGTKLNDFIAHWRVVSSPKALVNELVGSFILVRLIGPTPSNLPKPVG